MQNRNLLPQTGMFPFSMVRSSSFNRNAPFGELSNMMTQMMDNWMLPLRRTLEASNGHFPHMDVSDRDSFYEICMETPGVAKKDLDISLKDNVLSVSGEKGRQQFQEDRGSRESFVGKFSRSIVLPEDVDENAITAELEDGILKISLQKKEKAIMHFANKLRIG